MTDTNSSLAAEILAAAPNGGGCSFSETPTYIVSRRFREGLIRRFPIIRGDTEIATVFRRLLAFVLTCPYRSEEDGEAPGLLFPYDRAASLVGVSPRARGHSARNLITAFSNSVFPLNPREYRYVEGKARLLRPVIPPDLIAARDAELLVPIDHSQDMVSFVEGHAVTVRSLRALRDELLRIPRCGISAEGHPAEALLRFLNNQPPHAFNRIVQANWDDLCREYQRMPSEGPHERLRRDAAFRVVDALRLRVPPVYGPVKRSPRVFARGTSLGMLPRELRKVALRGCIQMDLRACQLAVIARLWHARELQAFLATGANFWDKMLKQLELGPERKPFLKAVIYPIAFGMSQGKVRARLANGFEGGQSGIGPERAREFFRDPLIADLWRSRRAVAGVVEREGGVMDAFNRRISTNDFDIPSILAQQAQSYEVRLMLSVTEVLEVERDIRVVCFLHDGMAIKITDGSEVGRKIRRLQDAVRQEAARLDIHTELDIAY